MPTAAISISAATAAASPASTRPSAALPPRSSKPPSPAASISRSPAPTPSTRPATTAACSSSTALPWSTITTSKALPSQSGTVSLTPGEHNITIGYYQGGGLDGLYADVLAGPAAANIPAGGERLPQSWLSPFASDLTIASLTGAGSLQLNGGNLITGGDNSNTTFSGAISGGFGLVKTGSGTMFSDRGQHLYRRHDDPGRQAQFRQRRPEHGPDHVCRRVPCNMPRATAKTYPARSSIAPLPWRSIPTAARSSSTRPWTPATRAV